MNLKDEKSWNECVKNNDDPYGKCAVDVARRTMEILDNGEPFDTHELICRADKEVHGGQGSLTGFLAGAVASMVSECHERGEEFRSQWNVDNQCGDEGEKANESGGVLNPALLTIDI